MNQRRVWAALVLLLGVAGWASCGSDAPLRTPVRVSSTASLAWFTGERLLLRPWEAVAGLVIGAFVTSGFYLLVIVSRAPGEENVIDRIPLLDKRFTRMVGLTGAVMGGVVVIACVVHLLINMFV